eukprot:TRINITY_DN67494_c0_g1_i1.p1 TRINITY_DN67494_c0_g1~~TRINITY_DN67494_c0_g1_i1.p1  ORF type:complete len:495 (+),score=78.34 TRINITY_DN67494_c0_g1_i1:63-1487(+)
MAKSGQIAHAQNMQTLLVVLPGNEGRRPLLNDMQRSARICVLAPSVESWRYRWSLAEVGADSYIEWDGPSGDPGCAFSAVEDWLIASDDSALDAGKARHFDGVLSYDEFGLEICAFIVDRLGLPGTPLNTIAALREKLLFRDACAAAGVPGPRYARIRTEADLDNIEKDQWPFPSILKPVKGGGSWHVQRVDSLEECRRVYAQLSVEMRDGPFPQEIRDAGFIIEEFFVGHEVDVDGWARDGVVEFSMVSDNRAAIEPYMLELGGIYPSRLPATAVDVLKRLTAQVVAAFPGIHACFHFEAKIDLTTLRAIPIELNCRVGGAECPLSVEAVSGYNLFDVAARLALNKPTDSAEVAAARRRYTVVVSTNHHIDCSGVVRECSDEKVNKSETKVVTSVVFSNKVGRIHVPNNGSSSCFGWLAVGGCSYEEAETNLQKAIWQLNISVLPKQCVCDSNSESCRATQHLQHVAASLEVA